MSTQCTVCLGKLGTCDSCDRDGVCVRFSDDGMFCDACRGGEPHAFDAGRDTAPPSTPERRAELAQDEADAVEALRAQEGCDG